MGQSITKNFTHIVFSTKHRQPFITGDFENELYAYLGSICNSLDHTVIKVGGHLNHVHILCMLSKNVTLVKLMSALKINSSRWAKTKGENFKNFYWQDGYGSFSVNPSQVDVVIHYITHQHQHHQKKTFQDEYRGFLKKYKVDFDERFIWD